MAPEYEASWWLGHEYRVAKHEVGVEYGRWTRMFGPVFRIKAALWQKDVVVISDNVAVKHIYQNAYTYVKSPAFQPVVVKVVGRGVVWAEGDEHKFQRKMVSPGFSITAVKKMAPGVMACVDKMIHRLQNDCKGKNDVFNMCDYVPACTLDIIGQVGFGYDFGHETPEGKAILQAWHTDVKLFSTFAAFLAPIVIGVAPWITKLPIKELHEDSTAKKVIHQVGRKLLQEPPNMDGTDIFSILVRESYQDKKRPSAERRLDDNTLLDNILSFFMAGFETTSGAIQLILLDLAKNPEVQSKLRDEILNADSSDVDIIESLPYLDAVTREGLRLHPSARDTHRVAIHDDIIPLKNPVLLGDGTTVTSIPVKAGDGFTIPFLVQNTDPSVWGSDSYEFKPERWMKDGGLPQGSELPGGPFSNISNFVDGPRLCIGWRLAIQEIKLILSSMIKNFEFRDTGAKVEKYISPAVQPFVDGKAAQLPLKVIPLQH
ncbi:cytochrome P450 [Cylindrobasidium torrendii FP15055 ss-10]|uniref:Cytochrome P450 n=1 Tax=Cylindrobasidium torrendii FP15055 ss-10 TaxID=1314674 RepID=A0A0D7AZZ8_9AGAR|nr:cytochrome P450 [Cylindrobasidium torrendii FP15055 ss-10]